MHYVLSDAGMQRRIINFEKAHQPLKYALVLSPD
jgi:hypothetical protein